MWAKGSQSGIIKDLQNQYTPIFGEYETNGNWNVMQDIIVNEIGFNNLLLPAIGDLS